MNRKLLNINAPWVESDLFNYLIKFKNPNKKKLAKI